MHFNKLRVVLEWYTGLNKETNENTPYEVKRNACNFAVLRLRTVSMHFNKLRYNGEVGYASEVVAKPQWSYTFGVVTFFTYGKKYRYYK